MSLETAKAFVQHIETNDAHASVVEAFDVEGGTWDFDKLVEFGQAAGFEFSGEDITAVLAELSDSELSDGDLNQIAGGIFLNLESGGGGNDNANDPWLPAS